MNYSYTRPTPDDIPDECRFWNFNFRDEERQVYVTGLFCGTMDQVDAAVGLKLYFPPSTGVHGGGFGAHAGAKCVFSKDQCISLANGPRAVPLIKAHLEGDYTINSPLEHVVEEWPEGYPER